MYITCRQKEYNFISQFITNIITLKRWLWNIHGIPREIHPIATIYSNHTWLFKFKQLSVIWVYSCDVILLTNVPKAKVTCTGLFTYSKGFVKAHMYKFLCGFMLPKDISTIMLKCPKAISCKFFNPKKAGGQFDPSCGYSKNFF